MRASWHLAVAVALAFGLAMSAFTPSGSTGVTGRTPSQWLAASVSAAEKASSVRVVSSHIRQGRQTWAFDILSTGAGHEGTGSVWIGAGRLDLVLLGNALYFKANAAFWRSSGASSSVVQFLAGRWMKDSATSSGFRDFAQLLNLSYLFGTLSFTGGHGALVAAGRRTIDGHPAVGVTDTATSGGGTLWIAATGQPYPLLIVQTGGPGRAVFEDWNAPAHIAAPRGAINLPKGTH